MKDKSKKHDHKGTKILKLGIFTSVMLAPLFAIGFKCAYATFNKNAYQSYSDKYVEQTIYINASNINDLYVQDQEITLLINKNFSSRSGKIGFSEISLDLNELLNTTNIVYKSFELYTYNSNFMYFYDANETQYALYNMRDYFTQFTYKVDLTTYNRVLSVNYGTMYTFTYITETLDNAFYYAVDQMKDNELFSWTKNTALYTPINAMTSGLGITTDAIAVLLAYWLYITLIYVVFDIVIELFTYLSHLIMGNPIG